MKKVSKGERDLKLTRFVELVRDGKTPSPELLEYVASGIEEFLEYGKAYWPIKKTNGARGWRASKAYALESAGIPRERAAELLGLLRQDGKDHTRNHRDLIKYGEAIERGCGPFSTTRMYVILDQLDELGDRLTPSEERLLESEVDRITNYEDPDDREPNYD